MKRAIYLLFLFLFVWSGAPLGALTPGEEAARHHRDFQSEGEGVVVARVSGDGAEFGVAGLLGKGGGSVDADTLFEIGSITKVFTGILLADAVRKGKAELEDPVAKHLPADLLDEDSPLHELTLLDLATHTSGLPRLPHGLEEEVDPEDPYAHYSEDRLLGSLKALRTSDLEKRGELSYSNFGMGLLGFVLERISGDPYEILLRKSILDPLGMDSTYVQRKAREVPASLAARRASPHRGGKVVSPWHIDALCGAGAIVSSARDLAAFAAALWSQDTPAELRAAMELAAAPQRGPTGLGWFVDGGKLRHEGGTGGFRSELVLSRPDKTATIRLMNSSGPGGDLERKGDFALLAGFWQGVLEAGAAELRVVLRISEDGRVAMHSLDQGATGIPAEKAVHESGVFRAAFGAIGGRYEARREGDELVGIWEQGGAIPLRLQRQAELPEALRKVLAERVEGDLSTLQGWWSGSLGGEAGLFLMLEVEAFAGVGEARLYSPDQTPEPLPITKFSNEEGTVRFSVDTVGGRFTGRVEKGRLVGSWSQGGQDTPLILAHTTSRPERGQ